MVTTAPRTDRGGTAIPARDHPGNPSPVPGRQEHVLKPIPDVPRWQKNFLLPVLLFYVALLALGSWREEIRPAFLDRAQIHAAHWLNRVGLVAGMGVFTTGTEESPMITAHSVIVRGVDRQGRELDLGPGPAEPPRGLLLFTSQEKVLLSRILMNLHTLRTRDQQGLAYRAPAKMRRLLKTLVQHYRWKARRDGHSLEQLQLLWTLHGLDPATGEPRRQAMLALPWLAGDDSPLAARWFPGPDDPIVVALGSNP